VDARRAVNTSEMPDDFFEGEGEGDEELSDGDLADL
jgi:hypothetical protein